MIKRLIESIARRAEDRPLHIVVVTAYAVWTLLRLLVVSWVLDAIDCLKGLAHKIYRRCRLLVGVSPASRDP